MRSLALIIFFCSSMLFAGSIQATEQYNEKTLVFKSPGYQTSLLELYTSEGCSSCPPAEAWLADISDKGFEDSSVIPLAFHVTYWDYIGWKDRFSKKQFDQRQRKMARNEGARTVYTPQFFLNGKTIRRLASLKTTLGQKIKQDARLLIKSSLTDQNKDHLINIELISKKQEYGNVQVNIAAYKNNLKSSIKAGENAGRDTIHQYVVDELQTASVSLQKKTGKNFVFLNQKQDISGYVVFVEENGLIIQALNMPVSN